MCVCVDSPSPPAAPSISFLLSEEEEEDDDEGDCDAIVNPDCLIVQKSNVKYHNVNFRFC